MQRILLSLVLVLALFAGTGDGARADDFLTFRIEGLPGDPAVPGIYQAVQGWMPASSMAMAGGRIETAAGVSSVSPCGHEAPQ